MGAIFSAEASTFDKYTAISRHSGHDGRLPRELMGEIGKYLAPTVLRVYRGQRDEEKPKLYLVDCEDNRMLFKLSRMKCFRYEALTRLTMLEVMIVDKDISQQSENRLLGARPQRLPRALQHHITRLELVTYQAYILHNIGSQDLANCVNTLYPNRNGNWQSHLIRMSAAFKRHPSDRNKFTRIGLTTSVHKDMYIPRQSFSSAQTYLTIAVDQLASKLNPQVKRASLDRSKMPVIPINLKWQGWVMRGGSFDELVARPTAGREFPAPSLRYDEIAGGLLRTKETMDFLFRLQVTETDWIDDPMVQDVQWKAEEIEEQDA